MTRTILPLAIVAILGGCSTLPRDGPSGASVNAGATTASTLGSYALVPLTYEVTERIKQVPPQFFGTLASGSSEQPVDIIGEGDALAISVYGPSGGLFGVGDPDSVAGSTQVLPAITVDQGGAVAIPMQAEYKSVA